MKDCDQWPLEPEEQASLLLALDLGARSRVATLEPDPVRRERIVDIASDRLLRRMLDGNAPTRPRAWFRRVVSRLLKSNEIQRRGLGSLPHPDSVAASIDREASPSVHALNEARREWLLNWLPRLLQKRRHIEIIQVALRPGGTTAAARTLNMPPSNLRRALLRLTNRISAEIRERSGKNWAGFVPPPPSW